ncbi:MAG: cytochrome c biogenesis protein CcsA [Actinomycetia bacterium]|nr:cytochrome c biogenesis protein CcsA [Actinomycetes bacterium]
MLLLGQLGMWIGLVGAVVAAITLLMGRMSDNEQTTRFGYYSAFASLIGITISTLVIAIAFFIRDYSIYYVASNRSTDVSALRWLYDLSGVWAGREGSLLFWAWLLALFTGYVAWRGLRDLDELTDMALMVLNIIIALFCIVLIVPNGPNNPFIATPAHLLVNGNLVGQAATIGMNPLLQHWAMILHPPTLFIGYAGLAVPFAYAMAALIVDDPSSRWVKHVDRITMFAWLFLGAGIGLGSIWAYVVLGWGGYWGWDPVENASILPWFVGVGLIHSFTIYRLRDGFKRWAILFSAVTFAMVILGTWITRSGLVQSVHAFAPDTLSARLFGFMIWGPIIIALIGLAMRWDSFSSDVEEIESLSSRESAYYLTNVLMFFASFIIAALTTSSWWSSFFMQNSLNQGPMAYERLARPIGILFLAVLAVCPLLSWGKTEGRALWGKIKIPLIFAAGILALLIWEWISVLLPTYDDMVLAGGAIASDYLQFGKPMYAITTLLGFGLSAFLITNTLALFARGVRARMNSKGESALSALWSVLTKARTQSGGYICHIAIGIIVIGLIGSSMYVRDVSVTVPDQAGETIEIADYTLTFIKHEETELANGDVESRAYFDVTRGGRSIGTVVPSITEFALNGMTRYNAHVVSEPLRDIFLVYHGVVDGGLDINVKINPLIWFVWAGFGLLLVGTVLAMWPKRKHVLTA